MTYQITVFARGIMPSCISRCKKETLTRKILQDLKHTNTVNEQKPATQSLKDTYTVHNTQYISKSQEGCVDVGGGGRRAARDPLATTANPPNLKLGQRA